MGLDDVVEVNVHGLDHAKKGDLIITKNDYGLGKLVTGLVGSTLIGVGAIRAGVSHVVDPLYDIVNTLAPVPALGIYDFFLPWASFGAGIGYALADTQKQKAIPGAALAATFLYSTYETLGLMGIPASYAFSSAATLATVVSSAAAPVLAIFGAGWFVGYVFKKAKERSAKKRAKGKKGK